MTFNDDFTFEFEIGERENGEKLNLKIGIRHNIIVKEGEDNLSRIDTLAIHTERNLEDITETIKFASPDIYEEIEIMAQQLVDEKFEKYERGVA